MKLLPSEVFYKGIVFGEGARWYKDQLWLSDMYGHKIYRFDDRANPEVIADMGDRHPSGLAFLYDGSVLVNSMKEKKVLRLEGDQITTHADLSGLVRACRPEAPGRISSTVPRTSRPTGSRSSAATTTPRPRSARVRTTDPGRQRRDL